MNPHHARFALWFICNRSKYAHLSDHEKVLAAALLVERFATYQQAWEAHPQFYPSALPVAMSAWRHEAYMGHSYSFVCASIDELTSPRQMQWGAKSLGAFAGVLPVAEWMPVHSQRVSTVSWSLNGSGKAFRARMALKALLPRKYARLVGKARRINGQDKYQCWKTYKASTTPAGQGRQLNPPRDEEYRRLSADWLRLYEFKRHYAAELLGLERYISVENFWACATGKVHPEEVIQRVTHQTSFI